MAANKPCQLSLIHCNLQSSFKNFALLKANLMNLIHQFSMIAISETGISKHDILSTIFDNYEFHSKIPKSNKKGGVGIYFKNGCIYSRRHDLDFVSDLPVEDKWFDVDTYVIGVIYRHPNNSIESFVSLLEQTINKIQKENKPYILCGDINIDLLHPDITNCQL